MKKNILLIVITIVLFVGCTPRCPAGRKAKRLIHDDLIENISNFDSYTPISYTATKIAVGPYYNEECRLRAEIILFHIQCNHRDENFLFFDEDFLTKYTDSLVIDEGVELENYIDNHIDTSILHWKIQHKYRYISTYGKPSICTIDYIIDLHSDTILYKDIIEDKEIEGFSNNRYMWLRKSDINHIIFMAIRHEFSEFKNKGNN